MFRLFRYLKNYKKESVIGPLFKLIEACFELAVPVVMKRIIDIGIKNEDMPYILRMGGIMVLLGFLGLACSLTAQFFAAKASVGFGTALRTDLLRHIDRLSYSEIDKTLSYETVTDTHKRKAYTICILQFDKDTIITTPEHPFWDYKLQKWENAGELNPLDCVQTAYNAPCVVKNVELQSAEGIDVYNLTVSNNHTYYIGSVGILVHNTCDKVIAKMRRKGVTNAWQEEVKAVQNGTSRYNWTPEQIKELLSTGKVSGYDGHHIVPVSQLRDTAKEYLISSADDIALIPRDIHHVFVHAHNNPVGDMDVLVKYVPWAKEQLAMLMAL